MLDLDPDTRITAEGALAHGYLKQYADPSDEPASDPYDQSFEEKDMDIEQWKSKFKVIYIILYYFTLDVMHRQVRHVQCCSLLLAFLVHSAFSFRYQ